ncbi:MAG: family 16 glycosylhydrolase [Catenulispora sp.]|nr:family 16 glycosylhydrolase [Catenulispora sp.]
MSPAPPRTASPRTAPPRLRLAATLAALLALALSAYIALPTTSAQASAPPTPSGWTQTFLDDFNGASGSGIDSQWIYNTGPGSTFGTGEIETMTNSTANVHLDGGGNLDITALGSGSTWTSGRVQTASANVGAPAGGKLMVTASIQQPTGGLGYWPAFWMLGPGQWPENGEIDIMEDVNALSEVAGTIHCGTYPGGVCNEGNGIGSGLRACSGCQSGFHTYTMVLDRTNTSAESISFSLDGSQYFSVNESQVGASTWQQAFDHNLSIILDLAMGGAFPNGVCGCTTPTSSTASGGTMRVDYVAAYTTTGSGPPPPPPGSGAIHSAVGSNICLDDRSSSTANYNPVQIYGCNGTAAQQWTVVQAGSTLHVLGKCLDVYAAGTANGTKVDLYDCNNTGSQVFIPQSNGSLYNPQSGRCLDVPSATTQWSTQVQIWDCNGTNAQRWTLP